MITVQRLSVQLGAFSLRDVSFDVATGEYAVLMGKTGSGKTTILEAICGLRPVADGIIRLGGRDVTHLKPAERGIGYVPQDGALFGTMTVADHLAFSPRLRRWSQEEIHNRVEELAEMLQIHHLLHRKPAGLSGGEAQRVALGRALAARPEVLCLDEPLSALDDDTRGEMYDVLNSVKARTGVTALHITHSLGEATGLADRVLMLRNGAVAERDDLTSPLPGDLVQPLRRGGMEGGTA